MDESAAEHRIRTRVFIDFWNFQLSLNESGSPFKADWRRLGPLLAREALRVVDEAAGLAYQGMNVYGSYGEKAPDLRLQTWVNQTLSRFPGVYVKFLARRRKHGGPVCPSCHKEVSICPHCNIDMRGTEEKGVDTHIATDMISLAWTDNYDVAVLVSSDRDFIPVVEFLETKGIKVVHGLKHPLIFEGSDDGEDIAIERSLHEHLSKPIHEGTQAVFGPVGDVLIEHQALSEQRMGAVLHGVGP